MMDLVIKKAALTDARAVVRLIALADSDAVLAVSGKSTLGEALLQYEQDFSRTDVYFSHENVMVARKNDRVVGCILYFKGSDEERYAASESQGGALHRESADDEIYIDSLAVDPNHRGAGIAGQLLRSVFAQADAMGFAKVALLMDPTNLDLIALYRHVGFVEERRIRRFNFEYAKLVHFIAPR